MAESSAPPVLPTLGGSPGRDPQPSTPATSRIPALAGLAGAVVYVVGVLLPGTMPKPDATGSSIATFFVDKRGVLLTGFALQVIAVGLLLWFVGQLYQLLVGSSPAQRALATTMLAAFVATIAIVAAGIVPSIALIWGPAGRPGPELAGFAYAIMTISTYAATSTVAAVSILAASLIIWRTQVLPRWLCILGAVEIALNAVELIGLSSRHGILAGGYLAGIGPFVYILWFAAASISMAARARPHQPPAAQPR
jgi:hypothetical protein